MRRPTSSLAIVVAAFVATGATGCSPLFDVAIDWTIAGLEPTAACSALPEGTAIAFSILSRDHADDRFAGAVTETTAAAQCQDGTKTIQTGPFADVIVSLKDGDTTIGSAPAVAVAPGSASRGAYVEGAVPASVDIVVLQGSLTANLTVGGASCSDAGATSFTVNLFEGPEPNALIAVDGAVDVNVPCADGKATFTFSPVHLNTSYRVQATTTIGDVIYSTASVGEGILPTAPATFMTVDLQSR